MWTEEVYHQLNEYIKKNNIVEKQEAVELPYKTKDECVACRKASQAIEKCDREIRSIISEYHLDPTVDYNKINEGLEELKKRIVERRAELNK